MTGYGKMTRNIQAETHLLFLMKNSAFSPKLIEKLIIQFIWAWSNVGLVAL